MLTRLEVEGFKNLVDLKTEFGAFTCIAGENAAGKSNLFDAIEFLALLADRSLMEAAQEVRSTTEKRTGDARDLFLDGHRTPNPRMKLAAEMITPPDTEDDFGQPAHASITFLRYEIEIGYEPPEGPRRMGRLLLLSESLRHINQRDAPKHLKFPHSRSEWRERVVTGRRSGTDFISTETERGERLVKIHQDGGSRGQPKVANASRAPATVISTATQANSPTILAARREMQSWRRLALEPSSLRAPDSHSDADSLSANGLHLAATLYRVANAEADPDTVYARVASRLSGLTGLRVDGLTVDVDESRQSLTVILHERSGISLPARSLSEGTLRFLALCVLLEDSSVTGLICMEEPENGIHPANIPAMVQLLQDLAVDVHLEPGPDNPSRQVIINTHSPNVVQLVSQQDLLFADARPVITDGRTISALRLRPMKSAWRASEGSGVPVGKADLVAYLTAPVGAQLRFDVGLTSVSPT